MKKVKRYFIIWKKLTGNSFMSVLSSRFGAFIFLLGKFLRFTLFALFLFILFSKITTVSSYSIYQALFFFLTFNLIDTLSQLFFREVYRFRQLVITGDFDLVLTKPMNPLFRALAGGADPLDLIMLVPFIGILIFIANNTGIISIMHVLYYLILIMNGLFIATGFHILVLSLAIVTTEIDHAVMIYRDLTSMGRVPVDIYQEPLRSVITFIIPIGIMMSFPAKAFLGLLAPPIIMGSLAIGVLFLGLSIHVWRFALTQYSSASS